MEVKTKSELDKIINANDLVIVRFHANWCGPCRMLGSIIANIEAKNMDTVVFAGVNVDEADEEFVANSGVRNIPVLKFYKNGALVGKNIGLISEQDLINKIKVLKED